MEGTAITNNDQGIERRKEERRKGVVDLGDALNRINLIINSTFDYDEIMNSVVVEAAKAIGCESSSIAIREGTNWIIRYIHGMPQEWIGRSFSDKEAPHALFAEVSKRPVAIDDAFHDKRVNNEVMKALGIRSVLVIPLMMRGRIIGNLFFTYHSTAVTFSEAQIDFANKVGTAASLALENARLYEELKKRESEIEREKELSDALNHINMGIHATVDPDEIMQHVIVEATRAIGAETSMIFLLKEKKWVVEYVYRLPGELIRREFTGNEVRHTVLAADLKSPVVVNNVEGDDRVNPQFAAMLGIRSLLDFPLIVRGDAVGDFVFHYHSLPHVFSEIQIDFVQKLGAAVSLALDNAYLYRELSKTQEREKFFANVIETSAQPFAAWYPDGRLMIYNHAFVELAGYGAEELTKVRWATDLTPPEWREYEAEVFEKLHRTGEPQVYEKEYVRKDGLRVPIEIIVHQVPDREGQVQYYYAFISDITRRKRAESDLQQAKSNLEGYVNELEQRNREIEMLSAMGGLLQASLTVEEAHGVIAKSVRQIFTGESGAVFLLKGTKNILESIVVWGDVQLEDQVVTPKECWALRLGRVYSVEDPSGMLCPHVKGTLRTAYICTPLVAHNETLGLLYLQLSTAWRDHSKEERTRLMEHKKRLAITTAESVALSLANFRLREVLYNQSIRDPLTELFNRRYMKEIVEKEMHRTGRKGRPVGIIMLDIDHFKQVNDTHGHEAGDMLLHELGAFLQKQIREEDLACRYGGEEFVVVMPETSLENALRRAEQVRERVKSLRIHYRGSVLGPVTLSLGVAVFPEHGSTTEELLRAADAALYRAKAEGRDRVVTAS